MIKSYQCESCKTREGDKAVECPKHGRHYYCRHCNHVIHKVEELVDAIKEDVEDRLERGDL